MEFSPRIVAFLCNWCSYAGADLAGVNRLQMPPNVHVIRVMCSASVKPEYVFKAISQGIDGVLVLGCHIGDCHYITGNYYTEKRVRLMKRLLEESGLEADRLRLEWVSASEGEKFSKIVTEFTEHVRKLGPSKVKKDERLMARVAAADDASETFRLRALSGKEFGLVTKGNVYNNKLDPADVKDQKNVKSIAIG